MTFNAPLAAHIPPAVVVGTGRLTLDVIIRSSTPDLPPLCQAGGTCGNVLANLAYLGWQSHPLTDLGDDDPGQRFSRDLARWGVHLGLIRHHPDEQTPVIIHHIDETPTGARHHFSSRCPFCQRRLRYFEPVGLAEVEKRLPQVPRAQVFFFDRDSEGALLLARHQRQLGALVVYAPNYAGKESNFADAVSVSHVLEYAQEKLPGLAQRIPAGEGPWLVIETQGSQGLRFLDRRQTSGEWQHLPAWSVPVVRDAAGAGDWCTSGLLHLLGQQGAAGAAHASTDDLCRALTFGQALAAWNCAFPGARGGMYHVNRQRFQQDIARILAGEIFDPGDQAGPSTLEEAGRFCPCRGH